jgi:hypothetical protein
MKVSTARKLGVAARVATEQVGRNRTVRAGWGAVRTAGKSFGRATHQLWLEVTGTVFLTMALFGGTAAFREYAKYRAGEAAGNRVAVAICFTLAFAWFGLSSFWRARQKQRS